MLRVRGGKTEASDATIPLTPLADREMRAFWEALGSPRSGPAFIYKKRPLGDWKKALKTSGEAAGLGDHRLHPYVLRHSFASIAATSGVPLVVAQQIMRHTSSKTLLEVYAKAGALALREGLDKFGVGDQGGAARGET